MNMDPDGGDGNDVGDGGDGEEEKEEKKEKILPASGRTDGRTTKVIHEVLADLKRAK